MKLIYVNGHFYQAETKERVKIPKGIELTIASDGTVISKADKVGKHHKIQERDAQENKVKNNINVGEYKKVLERGTKLYFLLFRAKRLIMSSRLSYSKTCIFI